MSWWKDILFSCWLIVCQLFGFQSLDTFNTSNQDYGVQISVQPAATSSPLNLYENLLNLAPNDRTTYTCKGDPEFRKKILALKPPEGQVRCNTPETRQTWCQPLAKKKEAAGRGGHNNYNPRRRTQSGDGDKGPIDYAYNTDICFDYESPVDTHREIKLPNGVPSVLELTVEISYGDISPDGYLKKKAMLINGTYPGPLIEAYWGQKVQLTVINKLGTEEGDISNGTAIHPHGLRLWRNPENDGVPGVTQCPIPPGASFTYEWDIQQYGTTWYHSHLSLQYPNGVVAPMVLHGPKSGNYDKDLGAILLTDWYHANPFAIYSEELKKPQAPDSTLINGKGRFDCSSVTEPNRCKEGSYWEATFEPSQWHLLRFVNTATATTFRVSIDNHDMTVITADFTALRPSKPVPYIDIAVGQRYEVLVHANQKIGDFWLRSQPLGCNQGKKHIKAENVAKGIIRYAGSSGGREPQSETHLPEDLSDECKDMDIVDIVPLLARESGYIEFKKWYNASMNFNISLVPIKQSKDHVHMQTARLELGDQMPIRNSSESLFNSEGNLWKIAGLPMVVNWSRPALEIFQQDKRGKMPSDFPASYAVIEAKHHGGKERNQIVFHINGTAISATQNSTMHPIHIHGHDFVILDQGYGNFNESKMPNKLHNPVRRDVATMPAGGYLILSFPVDNEGIWLLHCHLAWHASQGLALLIMEKPESTSAMTSDESEWKISPRGMQPGNCRRWKKYLNTTSPPPNPMDDSGV